MGENSILSDHFLADSGGAADCVGKRGVVLDGDVDIECGKSVVSDCCLRFVDVLLCIRDRRLGVYAICNDAKLELAVLI